MIAKLYTIDYTEDKIIEKKNITELEITNKGTVDVSVNGKTLKSGKSIKLLQHFVASEINFDVRFSQSAQDNRVEFTYLQIVKDKPNCK